MKLAVSLLFFILALPVRANDYDDIWTRLSEATQLVLDGAGDSAMVVAERTLPSAVSQNEKLAEILLLGIIGTVQRERGRGQQALTTYRQAEKLISQLPADDLERLTNSSHIINIYVNLAELCNDLKKREDACRYARKAAKETEKKTDKTLRGTVFPQIGGILLECGHMEEAAGWLKRGYQEAQEANLPGNALVAASHLMMIEGDTQHHAPNENTWKKKADRLLPQVSSDYPRGIYYIAISHINLKAGELAEANKAQEEAMGLEGVKRQMTPEKSKEYLRQAEEEREEAYALRHQKRIRLITAILIGVLVVFACYFFWQQQRRKKAKILVEQQMGEQFLEGMENERSRMARELHDGISNELLAVEMKLDSDGLTEQTRKLLTESRERIRQVSHELMPPEFSHNTLDEVLAHYIDSINGAQGCEVTYQSLPENTPWNEIPQETALEVYRIAQEAIGNALKHAKASLIAVGMKKENNDITLTVADNGDLSFSAEKESGVSHEDDGIGSRTMQQRTKTINGTLTCQRTPFGTILQLKFPSS